MLDTAALLNVAHLQQRRFFAAQPVVEKNSQYRPVALPFNCCFIRRIEQRLRLVIAQCWRLAFVAFYLGTFYPMHWIAPGDRIAFQEVIKKG